MTFEKRSREAYIWTHFFQASLNVPVTFHGRQKTDAQYKRKRSPSRFSRNSSRIFSSIFSQFSMLTGSAS